jgi:hypothetical protein
MSRILAKVIFWDGRAMSIISPIEAKVHPRSCVWRTADFVGGNFEIQIAFPEIFPSVAGGTSLCLPFIRAGIATRGRQCALSREVGG